MEVKTIRQLTPFLLDPYRTDPIELISDNLLVYGTLRVGGTNYTTFDCGVYVDHVDTFIMQGFALIKGRLTAVFTGDPADLLVVDLLRRRPNIARHDWIVFYSTIRALEGSYTALAVPFDDGSELTAIGVLWTFPGLKLAPAEEKISCYKTQKLVTLEDYPTLKINWGAEETQE